MALGNFTTPVLVLLALAGMMAGCAVIADQRADTREARWEASHPPLGRLVPVDGRHVHLLEAGQPAGTAPDLVLIHGANGNLRDFTFDLVGRLADDYRIVAIDRPGLGWSDSWGEADSDPQFQARVLRRALAPLGLERPVLVAHSYGAAVALGWALEAEAETGALVLLGGATHPWPGDLGLWYRLNGSALGALGRQLLAGFVPESAAEGVFENLFAPADVPDGYIAHFGPGLSMRRASQANNTRQVNALLDHVTRMQPGYADLSLPIELVHGDADVTVGLSIHGERLAREVASARLQVIENGGHMPHHSHPEKVVAAIGRAAWRAGLTTAPPD
ncbi:MAG: alpha/beta hydrolase [Pararhodobacter sp.]|nr:alpha/beta hydrolase [Pararhodobacter sp.]